MSLPIGGRPTVYFRAEGWDAMSGADDAIFLP